MLEAIKAAGWDFTPVGADTAADVRCCGELVNVWSGIAGTDKAACETCGKTIRNLASPHMNGGLCFEDDDMWAVSR